MLITNTSFKKQSGLTLIEAMITLLVISIGLLGIAGLQISSLKQNSSANWHSQAVFIANNITDRIRANRDSITSYDDQDTKTANSTTNCTKNSCNSAEMVESDIREWALSLSNLPSGRGIISSPDSGQLNITVMWDDDGKGECGTDPKVDLTCYTIIMSTL